MPPGASSITRTSRLARRCCGVNPQRWGAPCRVCTPAASADLAGCCGAYRPWFWAPTADLRCGSERGLDVMSIRWARPLLGRGGGLAADQLAAAQELLPRAARVLAEATMARAAKLCHADAGAQGRP